MHRSEHSIVIFLRGYFLARIVLVSGAQHSSASSTKPPDPRHCYAVGGHFWMMNLRGSHPTHGPEQHRYLGPLAGPTMEISAEVVFGAVPLSSETME